MLLSLYLQSLLLGASIAAPLGPICLLCITITLHHGLRAGFLATCGAATADMLYALVAGLGLTWITTMLFSYQSILALAGSSYLLYMGTMLLIQQAHQGPVEQKRAPANHIFIKLFGLTLTNPMTIMAFLSAFTSIGSMGATASPWHTAAMVAGVSSGSLLWGLGLCLATHSMKSYVLRFMPVIDKISGIVIILFALKIIVSIAC
jgi:threonine/homoserine/homoserine lactone efflux protein